MLTRNYLVICLFYFLSIFIRLCVYGDNLALLSGTLRTYQKASCDEEWLVLRCPSQTTISIQLAQYGKIAPSPALCKSPSKTHPSLLEPHDPRNNLTCLWPTAIQTVVGLCQKKTSCKFLTSPRTFGGDPCPSIRKYVEVAFKCRPSEFKSVIGCENKVIELKCNRSSRIAIYSANFGRTEYESIQCPQPKGVREESCLSSYATETVMQMCHGKRKCALGADSATFGNPCKPESAKYLKVIHTCVPRKTLKEKYQGEAEEDELFDDEGEEEESEVIEQPSIYSPDHSKPLNYDPNSPSNLKTTLRPPTPSFTSSPGNGGKYYLYIGLSIASGLLMLLFLLFLKMSIRRVGERRAESRTSAPSEISNLNKPSVSSRLTLSEIDEESLKVEQNDIVDLHSILRHSSPPEEYFTTLGRSSKDVVRFSNSRSGDLEMNPRSLSRDSTSGNIHFFYG